MLRILGKSSSINVRKVLWTCAELAIDAAREDWGSGFRATDTPEFLALNPNAMVPVLIDGDFVLWESHAIIRYLCAAYGGGALYTAAPRDRARIDQWMDWQATELNTAWRYAFMALVRQSPAHQDAAQMAVGCDGWNRHMAIVDRQLSATGGYIAGSDFSLADISVGLSVHRWLMTPMTRPNLPAVLAYYDRLSERPGFMRFGRNGVP